MLYLTRKMNETVFIGNDIKVKVMAINGKSVVLGFIAPKDVAVHREEVVKRIIELSSVNDCEYQKPDWKI